MFRSSPLSSWKQNWGVLWQILSSISSHINSESRKLGGIEEVLEEVTACSDCVYGSYQTKAESPVFAVQF